CDSTFISEDICCGSSGPARNGTYAVSKAGAYSGFNTTSPESCCQSCYADCNCISYYFKSYEDGSGLGACNLYGKSGLSCSNQAYSSPSSSYELGT
ncbi:19577_t:CDS:1, partial [Cetraspora pellucida]